MTTDIPENISVRIAHLRLCTNDDWILAFRSGAAVSIVGNVPSVCCPSVATRIAAADMPATAWAVVPNVVNGKGEKAVATKRRDAVRADGEGRYMIVAGERRFRAHQVIASRGGGTTIDCLIRDVDDAQLAVDSIIENDQRIDVTLMEQARSYKRMIDVHGFSVESLAVKLGKRPHKVAEALTLNNLTPECVKLLEGGNLYQTQALALAGLSARGQGLLLRQINQGQCRTVTALKAIAQTIADNEAQMGMFSAQPAATTHDINSARSFETKIDQIAAMLRQGIDENVIVAVKKVNPGRASTIAELLAQMQKDLHRIEAGFRVAAVQEELAA